MNQNENTSEGEPLSRDTTAFQVFNEIGIIAQISGNLLERALPGEMKMSHFVVLNHFVRLGGERTPQELARIFQVTKGAMTNTIQRLEAQGYVSVSPDPKDQRAKRIALTDAGAQARQQAVANIAPLLDELGRDFGATDLQAALPFLRQLRQWLGARRGDVEASVSADAS